MAENKIVGIVGLNERAREFTTLLLEWGHTVVGTDANRSLRESFAEEFNVVLASSLDELLEYPLDSVVITTPNRYHLEPLKKIVDEEYDVLLEKPLAQDFETAESVAAVCERANADCRVAFHLRCSRGARILRSKIEAGNLGQIYHGNVVYINPRGIPALGSWMTSRELSGGGALIDIGSHALDLIQYLIGFKEFNDVTGVIRQKFDPAEYDAADMYGEAGTRKRSNVEDSSTALIKFEDGTSTTLESHWAANQPRRRAVRLYGTEKGALLDQHARQLQLFDPDSDEPVEDISKDMTPEDWSIDRQMLDRFVGSSENSSGLATVDEALKTQRLVQEIYSGSISTL